MTLNGEKREGEQADEPLFRDLDRLHDGSKKNCMRPKKDKVLYPELNNPKQQHRLLH